MGMSAVSRVSPKTDFDLAKDPDLEVEGFRLLSSEEDCLPRLNKEGWFDSDNDGVWRKVKRPRDTELLANKWGDYQGIVRTITGQKLTYHGRTIVQEGDPPERAHQAIRRFLYESISGDGGFVGHGRNGKGRFELGIYAEDGVVNRVRLGLPAAF